MKLVYYPDSALKEVGSPVRNYTKKLSETISTMMELTNYMGGDGLAAPQVGINKRFFVARINGALTAFINPKIVAEPLPNTVQSTEGCLSAPGVMANLNCRKMCIAIEAKDAEGKKFSKTLTGTDAIVFQHELDHLNGITIFERMNRVQKRMRLNKLAKAKRRYDLNV